MAVSVTLAAVKFHGAAGLASLFLINREKTRGFIVTTSKYEGIIAAARLRNVKSERPGPIDILHSVITEDFGARIQKVVFRYIENDVAHVAVYIARSDGTGFVKDCRPTDAILLALLALCPIYVEDAVWREYSVEVKNISSAKEVRGSSKHGRSAKKSDSGLMDQNGTPVADIADAIKQFEQINPSKLPKQ